MKSYLVLIPLFALALAQGAFWRLNLVFLFTIVWLSLRLRSLIGERVQPIFLVPFAAGLFLDLAKGTTLGLSSLLLVTFSFLLALYSRKLDPWHPLFLPVFIFICQVIYSLIGAGFVLWLEVLILALLAFLVRLAAGFFTAGVSRQEIRLKI